MVVTLTFQHTLPPLGTRDAALWGAVIGAALGDAIGRFSEFAYNQNAIQSALKVDHQSKLSLHTLVSDERMLHGGKLRYTDDMTMAIPVLDECYNGRLNQTTDDEIISAIAKGFMYKVSSTNDPYYNLRAHGTTSPGILRILAHHATKHHYAGEWWRTGYTKHDIAQLIKNNTVPGCGSVMRVWPIGLIFFDDLPRAKKLAVEQSMITHPLPEASAACAAMVVGMAYAIRAKSPQEILSAMITTADEQQTSSSYQSSSLNWLHNQDTITEKNIFAFKKALSEKSVSCGDMLRYVQKISLLGKENALGSHNNILGSKSTQGAGRSRTGDLLGWTAGEAVAAAAYIFMRHATGKDIDTWNGIKQAVWTVGDSDSIATLAGALLGAYQGLSFPEAQDYTALKSLENYDTFDQLADEIYKNIFCKKTEVQKDGVVPLPE